jgi:hypothetical protein
MSCGCKQSDDDAQRKSGEVLDHVGLREIVDQGHGALSEASAALSHIARAERAEALGFGADVVRMHSDMATRSNRRACQQLEFLVQRIDARAKADDWGGLVKQVESAFQEHGGRERLEDARAAVRLHLLEQEPGLSGPVTEQALALLDRHLECVKGGNLDSVVDLMRENCRVALDGSPRRTWDGSRPRRCGTRAATGRRRSRAARTSTAGASPSAPASRGPTAA